MMDLPALRVYWAKHRSLGRPTPDVDWEDLDVLIAALDALEARLAEYRKTATNMRELHDQLDDENEALQARLDAATVLIRRALYQLHGIISVNGDETRHVCGSPLGTSIDTCENCRPYLEWLAGEGE